MPASRCVVQDCSNKSNPRVSIFLHTWKSSWESAKKYLAWVMADARSRKTCFGKAHFHWEFLTQIWHARFLALDDHGKKKEKKKSKLSLSSTLTPENDKIPCGPRDRAWANRWLSWLSIGLSRERSWVRVRIRPDQHSRSQNNWVCLRYYISKRLDFQVFSDKDNKP